MTGLILAHSWLARISLVLCAKQQMPTSLRRQKLTVALALAIIGCQKLAVGVIAPLFGATGCLAAGFLFAEPKLCRVLDERPPLAGDDADAGRIIKLPRPQALGPQGSTSGVIQEVLLVRRQRGKQRRGS